MQICKQGGDVCKRCHRCCKAKAKARDNKRVSQRIMAKGNRNPNYPRVAQYKGKGIALLYGKIKSVAGDNLTIQFGRKGSRTAVVPKHRFCQVEKTEGDIHLKPCKCTYFEVGWMVACGNYHPERPWTFHAFILGT